MNDRNQTVRTFFGIPHGIGKSDLVLGYEWPLEQSDGQAEISSEQARFDENTVPPQLPEQDQFLQALLRLGGRDCNLEWKNGEYLDPTPRDEPDYHIGDLHCAVASGFTRDLLQAVAAQVHIQVIVLSGDFLDATIEPHGAVVILVDDYHYSAKSQVALCLRAVKVKLKGAIELIERSDAGPLGFPHDDFATHIMGFIRDVEEPSRTDFRMQPLPKFKPKRSDSKFSKRNPFNKVPTLVRRGQRHR